MIDNTVLLQGLEEDLKRSFQTSQVCIQQDIRDAASHAETVIQHEHSETRAAVRVESDRAIKENADSVRTVETYIQATIEVRAEEDERLHQQTQKYIADLQNQLSQLTEHIKERDCEFRATLEALKEATTEKKRKLLYERSNAVAATLLALQIMYGHVKVITHHPTAY